MSDDLIISDKNWLDLKKSTESLPMPFKHEVLLKECHIAGTMHVGDIAEKTKSVEVGSTLQLKREPDNKYDSMAIRVETDSGERIGWIPQKYNEVLSRLMDAGKLLYAKVIHKEMEGRWLNIRVEVYLKDF